MVDKFVTAFAVMAMIKAFQSFNSNLTVLFTAFVGTVISGVVFLQTALFVVGSLPMAFSVLFTSIVIPAALINTAVTFICYKVVFSTKSMITHKA